VPNDDFIPTLINARLSISSYCTLVVIGNALGNTSWTYAPETTQ